MVSPAKVLGFLDLTGDWDPSLIFVILGALLVAAAGYRLGALRGAPVYASAYSAPGRGSIDRRLMIGAVLFGIGWGLVGYCPGPVLASVALGNSTALLFLVWMLVGMIAFRGFEWLISRREPKT